MTRTQANEIVNRLLAEYEENIATAPRARCFRNATIWRLHNRHPGTKTCSARSRKRWRLWESTSFI